MLSVMVVVVLDGYRLKTVHRLLVAVQMVVGVVVLKDVVLKKMWISVLLHLFALPQIFLGRVTTRLVVLRVRLAMFLVTVG